MTLRTKRVYDRPAPDDGARFLVDRLWPRGVRKEALRLDGWLKDLAPSDALRRRFGQRPRVVADLPLRRGNLNIAADRAGGEVDDK